MCESMREIFLDVLSLCHPYGVLGMVRFVLLLICHPCGVGNGMVGNIYDNCIVWVSDDAIAKVLYL